MVEDDDLTPADILVAPEEDLQEEFLRLCKVRKCSLTPSLTPRMVMTAREQDAEHYYRQLYLEWYGHPAHRIADLFVFLGDSPWSGVSWSAAGALPTYRTNTGLLWHPMSDTFVTANKEMASIGFPMFDEIAAAMGMRRLHLTAEGAHKAIGNAMHMASIYVVVLCSLASVRQI